MKVTWPVRLRFGLRRHGWPSVLGGLLLLVGFALFLVADAERRSTEELQTQLRTQRERLILPAPLAPTPDTGMVLAEFRRSLPGTDATVQAVDLLHNSAARHGVVLASGEYRLLADGPQGINRYQITLPASGSYTAVRAWLADALNNQPTLALDSLEVARQSAENPQVEARVRWSLYLARP